MKLLFFSSYYHPYISGLTTLPRNIFSYLSQKSSNKVTVLTFKHNDKLESLYQDGSVSIIRMPHNFRVSKGFISLYSIGYFFVYTKKSDKIILNIPNFEGLPLAILAKIFRKKITCVYHCKVKATNQPFSTIVQLFLNTSVAIQLHLSDKIIVFSKEYFDSVNKSKRLRRKTAPVTPPIKKHGIDNNYKLQLKKEKGRKKWIGFAGRISSEKGIHILIQAISQLKIKNEVQLIFAGPSGSSVVGESEYFRSIKDQLESEKIQHKFLGTLTENQLGSFYITIDVLVLPSINHTEAFGMVQVEAMKLGTPVIAPNLPGIRVPIKRTGMGIIINPGDTKSLRQAIQQVIHHPTKYISPDKISKVNNFFSSSRSLEQLNKEIVLK